MLNLTKQEIQYLLDSMKAHMEEGHFGDSQNYICGHFDAEENRVPYNIKRENALENKLKDALQ